MGFNKKVKELFKAKGLTNRDVSEIMDGYSETMLSKSLNKDGISLALLGNMLKYFPEEDYNYLLKDEETLRYVAEKKEIYQARAEVLVGEIKERINELETLVARK